MRRLIQRYDLFLPLLLSIIARIFSALSGFFLSLLLARELGAHHSGYYFLAFNVVATLSACAQMGLPSAILRFTSAAHAKNQQGIIDAVLVKSFNLTFLVALSLSLVLYFYADFIALNFFNKPLLAPVLQAMAIGMTGLSLLTLVAVSLQGQHRIMHSVFVLTISVNTLLLIAIYFLSINDPIEVAQYYSLATFLTFGIGLCFYLRYRQQPDNSTLKWRVLLKSWLPLFVVAVMAQSVKWSSQLIAGAYVPSEQIAQLAIAQRVALLISLALASVDFVVAPRFSVLHQQKNFVALKKLAINSVRITAILTLPVLFFMLCYPAFLLSLFGTDFSSGSHLLQILALGYSVNALTGSVCFLLPMSGHEQDLRNIVLVSGILAIILSLYLVPLMGVTGGAIAAATALATQSLISVWFVHKRLGFNILNIF